MLEPINTLMQKEVTRKEFLTTVGVGLAAVAGLSTLLRLLGKDSPLSAGRGQTYGANTYGGKKTTN